jgi:hypothetical protein
MAALNDLPPTNDPLQWLLSAMRCKSLSMRVRIAAAVAAAPYLHERPKT